MPWIKGANGLWHSYDAVNRREKLREIGRQRISGIRERLAAVINRDGWKRKGRFWRKPEASQ